MSEASTRPPGRRGTARAGPSPRARIEAALRDNIVDVWPWDEEAKADLVLDAGAAGSWTVRARGRHIAVSFGAAPRATATVYTDAETLAEVLEGTRCGAETWLKGFLRLRGSIALAMKLEGLIDVTRPRSFPQPRRITAAGVDTFYLEAGEGPPVLLLHGLGAMAASMLPTMMALSDRYRVVAVDLPGFGESSKPIRRYHAEFFAEYVVKLLDELGIERAHLVGNSMGGRISLEVAMSHPDRVDRLALFAPAMAFRRFRQFVPLVKMLRPELGVVPIIVPRATVMTVLKQIFSQSDRVATSWYDAAVDEFLRVFAQPRARISFFSAAREIYLDDPFGYGGFWNRVRDLSRPALFIWGDRDILVPAKFARHVEATVPEAKSIVLPDCGHVPQFEHPEVTHEHVLNFFSVATEAA